MRVFKTRWFSRYCKSEDIDDERLVEAIQRAESGLIDADLGGGLIKQRVARPGKGKSGGWRTLIAYRAGGRAIFLFGFAKSERENVNADELADLRAAAGELLALDDEGIAERLAMKRLSEVVDD
jgi:hypothetical protein